MQADELPAVCSNGLFDISLPPHCWPTDGPEVLEVKTPRTQELERENARLLEVIEKLQRYIEGISRQVPEKPDFWNSCGQCDRNIEDAQDILSNTSVSGPHPADEQPPKQTANG
jgi:hypothetical protein